VSRIKISNGTSCIRKSNVRVWLEGLRIEVILLNQITVVSGELLKDKATTVVIACSLWIPMVNDYSEFGR
jgi:hypothetical protein